jgi:hypothetical protein
MHPARRSKQRTAAAAAVAVGWGFTVTLEWGEGGRFRVVPCGAGILDAFS